MNSKLLAKIGAGVAVVGAIILVVAGKDKIVGIAQGLFSNGGPEVIEAVSEVIDEAV